MKASLFIEFRILPCKGIQVVRNEIPGSSYNNRQQLSHIKIQFKLGV